MSVDLKNLAPFSASGVPLEKDKHCVSQLPTTSMETDDMFVVFPDYTSMAFEDSTISGTSETAGRPSNRPLLKNESYGPLCAADILNQTPVFIPFLVNASFVENIPFILFPIDNNTLPGDKSKTYRDRNYKGNSFNSVI